MATNLSENLVSDRRAVVLAAQRGDHAAFDTLISPIRSGLFGIAFVRTGDRDEAEDITQAVLAAAWGHLADLRDPDTFTAWVRAILAQHCRTWFRRRRSPVVSLDDPDLDPPQADDAQQPLAMLICRERDEQLRTALRTIPEANRTALLMAVWGNCSYDQIAEFTAVPVTTVEGRIHRAKAQLRRTLRFSNPEFFGDDASRWHETCRKETEK
ncbi:MAG TPA: RNA polymerase sigma factor [Capsulimonadaceae bacterium]|jgi:RNA polymerase sigma-70 factor (ECF subfamily)